MPRDLPRLALGARPDVRADVATSAIKAWNPDLRPSAADDGATISIMDPIGADIWGDGVTSRRIEGALRAIGSRPVTVTINSPGGDVFEGASIYELLRQHSRDKGEVTVKILGLAASAASLIAMAGDKVLIGRSSFLMIHNCWVIAMGDRNAFAEVAEWLAPFDAAMADVYAARSGADLAAVAGLMDAETWLPAGQAIAQGFADDYLDAGEVALAPADGASASLRAERKFDLVAARAGLSRKDARALLHDMKSGLPGAAETGQPGAAEIEAGLSDLLASLKSRKVTQ